ncbi:HPr family phosphocarrier protein [Alicyclobacillus fodiniaquatilis]|uniref:Phosphocarrier protein HPr n=1 Tax=Alicyclobacillus fodiniaquatilis TaxID=1661150 RepID=A0ABW4JE62_9BACL
MQKQTVEVQSAAGLHARPASDFVNTAQRYKSEIKVTVGDKTVDGKSILGILSLSIAKGTKIEISANGPDEEEALKAIVPIVTS